jgi:hypothetical protein
MRPKNPKKITIEVSEKDYVTLKVYLAKRGVSMASWVREKIKKINDK